MKNYKILMIFVMLLLVLPMISAQEEPKFLTKVGVELDYKDNCFNNGTFCNPTSLCNLTVLYPNSTILLDNQPMTNQLSFHNFTFTGEEINAVGFYQSIVICKDGSVEGADTPIFQATITGNVLTPEESRIYLLLTVAIFVSFCFVFFFTFKVPYSNEVNNEGATIKVTRKKYVKLSLMLLSYGLTIWWFNILIALSDNYLTLPLYSGLVSFIFTTLINLSGIIPVVIIVIMGVEFIRDVYVNVEIKKFGSHAIR